MAFKCAKCQAENTDTAKFCSECAAPLQPMDDIGVTKTLETPVKGLAVGATFAGRYQILEELGKGGMGTVYKALDTHINEEVAIKLIRPDIASDEKTLERFSNELKLARKIGHKNVCKMFHLDKEGETPYISMEYLEGQDLKSLIRKKERLGADQAIKIAQQVCEGLVEAHRLGVVHRDLKPQNIMIAKDGQAKIMDFGIARSVEAPGVTQTGVIIGTPDYISPEQAEGREADERSDIYSLGVILYEMVTGQVPFQGDTALSVALKHKAQLPTDPRKWNQEIADDLSRLILICMEKDKGRRYQTAEALLADLKNIQEGFPLGTKIQPRRDTFLSLLFRKKGYVFASITILIILFGFLWFGVFKQKSSPIDFPTDKPRVAILYLKNNTGDEKLDYMRETLSDLLITDLEQSKYLYVIPISERDDVLAKLGQMDTRTYSPEVLNSIARLKPINHVIQGYYALSGGEFRININIQKAGKWETAASETAIGPQDNYASTIDELTKKIKPHLNLTQTQIADDIDLELGKITTSSPEAYRLYSEGMKVEGWREGIELMKKAVEIDPEFAMAYRRMAALYGNMRYDKEAGEYRRKALSLVDRVSDRERLLIQAQFESDQTKRNEKFLKLIELYPEDPIGNVNLGVHYMNTLEDGEKAVERNMLLVKNRVRSFYPYGNGAWAYRSLGMYDKAKEVLEIYINEIADDPVIRIQLAYTYMCQSKYELALEEVDKALALESKDDGRNLIKGQIYLLEGAFEKAEAEYLKMLNDEEISSHYEARWNLSRLFAAQGKFKEARKQAELAIELGKKHGQKSWEFRPVIMVLDAEMESGNLKEASDVFDDAWRRAIEEKKASGFKELYLYWKVILNLKMNSLEEAEDTVQEHKEILDKVINKKFMRYNDILQGKIALKEKNFETAIDYLERAVSLWLYQCRPNWDDHAEFMWGLALAYYESGDLDSAQQEFERITALTTGRLWWGNLYAKSFYMLGKIFEQKGWPGKAIENYEKFLDLWKDADPGLAEVEDAKAKLEALEN